MIELEQARHDVQRMVDVQQPVFADSLSTQPYATPVEKKTVHAIAAVGRAVPVQTHSPGLSLGASAGNTNLRVRNKGSNAMVGPVRRRLRTKTPCTARQRVPSVGAVRRRMRSKGPPPKLVPVPSGSLQASRGDLGPPPPGGGGPPGR